jgi:hypothetical protein
MYLFVKNATLLYFITPSPVFRCVYTQMWPSDESLRIVWPYCGLKLASPVIKNFFAPIGNENKF